MSYLERLKAKISENPPCEVPTKPTEPGFVGFVGEVNERNSEKVGSASAESAPRPMSHIRFAGDGRSQLPTDINAGLEKLRAMRCPCIRRPELWDEMKADALRIATEGWATQAIALGWELLQIFGYQPSDDPDDFSLAVELAGRSIVAVDESRFYLRQGDVRSFFGRRERPLLKRYLWDFDQ